MVAEAPRPDASSGAGPSEAGPSGVAPQSLVDGALDPLVQSQCSLSVQLRRATGSIVARSTELTAIAQAIREGKDRLSAMTLEGEPGIGKTRLLVATAELAEAAGFTTVAITADEEIRGPFLMARSLFANGALREAAAGTRAEIALRRVVEALGGRDEPGFESLSPDAKLLRAFDVAGIAIGELARVKPLALLLDDVQWADDDTLKLLRYAVRSVAESPVFLFLTFRPDEFTATAEAANFVADMERMGLVRRLRVTRFSASETGLLLRQVLGGPVEGQSIAAMQAQSEGVPFIVEELARTHRDAGTLQQVDGEWRLGRNAARLVPSAVKTLIQRRATRLPQGTLAILGEAGILGRSFSVRDVQSIGSSLGTDEIAEALQPAVEAGLLLRHPEADAADYTFTHEQVREFALNQLSNGRRREVHRKVVDLLLEGGEAPVKGLQMLAQHALAAGDTERAARFSIDAAAAALKSNAPEEALRLVDAALPVVSAPTDRRVLLTCRDDAYAVLRRSSDRLDGLSELGALAEAMRDAGLEIEVQLRRAAALRAGGDEEAAAELARRVRERAAAAGDKAAELRANLELGQAITKTSLGESFGVASREVDVDAAEEAFRRAITLADEIGDERSQAAALREVGTLVVSHIRDWFVGQAKSGATFEIAKQVLAGASIDELLMSTPIAPQVAEATGLFQRALEIYERLDDRTGVMSTVIAMAYISYAPMIHLTSSARHLEEIRRIITRADTMVTESERALQDLQMLFGVHVYARAKLVPDLALSRGEEAHRAAKLLGDQATEFAAAGGVAMANLELDDVEAADRWLGFAAQVASNAPTPYRTRHLESWRGRVRAAAGDAGAMRRHLEQAVALAGRAGAAARCEAHARLALEAARLGALTGDDELLTVAADAAEQAKLLAASLPGHVPWLPQADAALAEIALARGDIAAAVSAGAAAAQALRDSQSEDVDLDVLLPASRAIFAGAPEEVQREVREFLKLQLSRTTQATIDDAVRVRWLRSRHGSGLVELTGGLEEAAAETVAASPGGAAPTAPAAPPAAADDLEGLEDVDRRIIHLLTEGLTNREMAATLGLSEADLAQRLSRVLARLGASSRAEATSLAFRGLTPPPSFVAATGAS